MGAAAPVWNSMGGVNVKVCCDDSCRIAKLKQFLRKKKKKEEEETEQEDEEYEDKVLLRGPILREQGLESKLLWRAGYLVTNRMLLCLLQP